MAFLDTRFPEAVSYGLLGGPTFITDIVHVNSGVEYRNRIRAQSLGAWDASHNARKPAQYEPLMAFFYVAAGRFNTFRFRDWLDYQASSLNGAGVFTQLTATTFQMTKRYTFGAYTHDRYIYLPINGTVNVTGGSGVSVNYSTGVVTVTSGTPTAWTGEFDVHCRFDTDAMRVESFDRNATDGLLINWQSIPIIAVPL